MRISSLEEYALRCALQLARFKLKNELASASQIAELEGLSLEYVSKIMHLFRRGDLVKSTRGIQGGFALSQAPESISIKKVLDVIAVSQKNPENVDGFCLSHGGVRSECVHASACHIKPVWSFIFDAFDRVLTSITLADLIIGSSALTEKLVAQNINPPLNVAVKKDESHESL